MASSSDFLSLPGWKRFLVFFILAILLNALIADKTGAFAAGTFIAVAIGLLIAGSKKNRRSPARKKR